MRIVHVSHISERGGAELALARLLRAQRSWQAAVIAPVGGDAFDALESHGVTVHLDLPPLPTGGTRGSSPMLAARYLAALRASARHLARHPLYREADLIHANTAAAGIMCAFASRGRSGPLVVHLRDLVSAGSLGRFGFQAFTRIALTRADGVIANSSVTLRSAQPYLRSGVASAVVQSPAGIGERVTVPQVRADVRAVGMIGRLQAWKGQRVFLDAFARAFPEPRIRACLAGAPLFGEADYAEHLRDRAARLGIGERTAFLGHVVDIPAFLDSIDILVHASTRPEPLGQSVLQGLARAKPVVATEGGGPSEWITSGVNGLLVPPNRPDALAATLRALADSRQLRETVATGAASTEGLLTDDECALAHADVFDATRHIARGTGRTGRR